MNRRRLTDKEWVEYVEQGPAESPYKREDVWMVDHPGNGTCVFAAKEGRGAELVTIRRETGFDVRVAVYLTWFEARELAEFLSKIGEEPDNS